MNHMGNEGILPVQWILYKFRYLQGLRHWQGKVASDNRQSYEAVVVHMYYCSLASSSPYVL